MMTNLTGLTGLEMLATMEMSPTYLYSIGLVLISLTVTVLVLKHRIPLMWLLITFGVGIILATLLLPQYDDTLMIAVFPAAMAAFLVLVVDMCYESDLYWIQRKKEEK